MKKEEVTKLTANMKAFTLERATKKKKFEDMIAAFEASTALAEDEILHGSIT